MLRIGFLLLATVVASAQDVIPAGTQARLELLTPLSSKMSEVGDEFEAALEHSIVVKGRVLLRKGTIFRGHVSYASAAARGQRQGSLALAFDVVETQYGDLPVKLHLRSIDDFSREEKLRADDEGKVKGGRSGADTARNTIAGVGVGSAASFPIAIATSSSRPAALASVAAIGGGALTGVLLTRGKDVKLQPGVTLRVEFASQLVVSTASKAATSFDSDDTSDDDYFDDEDD
ncbi:MAG: hypothetical protein RMM17_01060 [Acidobacteriota bacterium]|nr:hypothetical protein [Blastocatellia bacterium]MDW8411257.1 hypothetical protein [Acidobacteriota bacterium]